MTTFAWIDVMGIEPTVIEATVIDERILVDEDVLETMAASVLEAEITSDEDDRAFADAIREAPRDLESGLFDITELGGGWDRWAETIIESEGASR